jgi:hypothetical protein
MVRIIYNRLGLIFFFICFFYNILLFRTNNIVVCQYSSFYTNKSEEELANQYVEDFKKDWRVDQYNICFKNNNFIKLLIEKFSQLSLLEIANVKSFFSPLLSEYIITHIKGLDNIEEQKKYIYLLFNSDSRILKDSYDKEQINIDHYIQLLMEQLKKLKMGRDLLRISHVINSAIIKYMENLSIEERREYCHLSLILSGAKKLIHTFLMLDKIEPIEPLVDLDDYRIRDHSLEKSRCIIKLCINKMRKDKEEISVLSLFNIEECIIDDCCNTRNDHWYAELNEVNKKIIIYVIIDLFEEINTLILEKLKYPISKDIKKNLIYSHYDCLVQVLGSTTTNEKLKRSNQNIKKLEKIFFPLLFVESALLIVINQFSESHTDNLKKILLINSISTGHIIIPPVDLLYRRIKRMKEEKTFNENNNELEGLLKQFKIERVQNRLRRNYNE